MPGYFEIDGFAYEAAAGFEIHGFAFLSLITVIPFTTTVLVGLTLQALINVTDAQQSLLYLANVQQGLVNVEWIY